MSELDMSWQEKDRQVTGCVGSNRSSEENKTFPDCHKAPREDLALTTLP